VIISAAEEPLAKQTCWYLGFCRNPNFYCRLPLCQRIEGNWDHRHSRNR